MPKVKTRIWIPVVLGLLCQSAVTAEEKLLVDTGVVTVPSDSVSVLSYGTDYHHILLDIEYFNWKTPVNYAEGTIHAYMEIISKPNDKLVQCYPILQEPGYGGDHWWTVRENAWKIVHPGVYTLILPMEKMRLYHKPTLTLDNPPALKILAVFKYPGGGKADNIPFEDSDYFPMKVRMLWVVVSKWSDFSGWDTYVKKSRPEPVEVMVPMRDGVKLHTKIWKPAGQGCYPVVFTRAYWPGFGRDYERFTDAGYVYVGQSTRGHSQSEGAHGISRRFFDDADDGYDSLTWISKQPWCNGNIAMYGKSYWAITQWLVAPLQHPNLKVIVPQNCNPGAWDRGYHDHGALQLAHVATRIYSDEDQRKKVEEYGWLKWYRHLPLITLDTVAGTKPNKLWHDYVLHSTYDDYWKANDIRDKCHKIKIPAYLMCGWYDNYPGATLKYFEKLVKLGATNEIRVVIDASEHLNRIVGDRDLGKNAAKDEVGLAIRWLDYLIKGIDSDFKNEPPVKIFVMGINQWRFENEWPLARTKFTNYYFHSNGTKDGQLSTEPPGSEPATRYTYDPDNPVPTLGGNHSFIDKRLSHIICAGPIDQRPNEVRDDVLVFTTPPLEKDTEVTGPIEVKLYAASSAKDTDFIARLIDVYPDGTAYNLTEGIIRARFRRSVWQRPVLLVPGKIYEYTIELQPTSNVFKRRHCIRVHLTSSGFPMWDRNPNTGREQGMDAEWQVAEQTIYHNKKYPSHIRLPVIP